jgi:putative ABC transport system permease protein
MMLVIPLAWLQLRKEKLRLFVAMAGVAFAVILIFMQLGFRNAMLESAVRYHKQLRYDLAMISPKTQFVGLTQSFSRRRLHQALAAEEVESVSAMYLEQGSWKNPWEHNTRPILVVGFDPADRVLAIPEVERKRSILQLPDLALFDADSRPEFGPVAARFVRDGAVEAEVNNRRVSVRGLFRLGSSFGIDGNLVTSDLNFLRLFPDRQPGFIDMGLIALRSGSDVGAARDRLVAALEGDVRIVTREEFIDREVTYWTTTTPVGFVFSFGAIMGFIVGGVVVYQILFADVSQHVREYATLKAMGYSNAELSAVVLQEAAILAVLGFVPGLLVSLWLYDLTADAIRQPLEMTFLLGAFVLLLTLAMCSLSAFIALRKVRSADPAEVFA